MNDYLVEVIVGQAIAGATGLLVAWNKTQSELVKLRSRVHVLEQSETKIQDTLQELVQGIRRIELLLAKKGIE